MSGFTVDKSDLELDLLADERTEERGGARSVAALEEPAFGAAAAAAGVSQERQSQLLESIVFFTLGLSGWWMGGAITAETPFFVLYLPEKQAIGSTVQLSMQIGNLFPFLYKGLLTAEQQSRHLSTAVLLSQAVATATGVLCALVWKDTVSMFGSEYSVGLIACAVVGGGMGILSNVTFWALAARYPGTHCIKATSLGMTVGGLVSAGLAQLQNAGREAHFGVAVFMIFCAAVQAAFLVALLSVLRRQTGPSPEPEPEPESESEPPAAAAGAGESGPQAAGLSKTQENVLVGALFIIYALTYTLPGVQPFMVKGYADSCSLDPAANSTAQASACALNPELTSDPAAACVGGPGCVLHNVDPSDDDLIRYMYTFQQLGDVAGRACAWVPWTPGRGALLAMGGVVAAISGVLVVAAADHEQVPALLPGGWSYIFPLLFFVYYLVRGYLVTALYVQAKTHSASQAKAERLAGTMGFVAQVGSCGANILLFLVTNVFGR